MAVSAIRRPPSGLANFRSRRQCGRRRCRHRSLYQRWSEMTSSTASPLRCCACTLTQGAELRWRRSLAEKFGRRLLSRESRWPCPARHPRHRGAGCTEVCSPPCRSSEPSASVRLPAAICLARDGFPMYPFMVEVAIAFRRFQRIAGTAEIYSPALPKPGDLCRTSGARSSSLWTRSRPQPWRA